MADSPNWEPDAKTFFDGLLSELPFFIRSQARTATTEQAEELARSEQLKSISRDTVIRAMVAITPAPMKGQLKALFQKKGVDMARYGALFQ